MNHNKINFKLLAVGLLLLLSFTLFSKWISTGTLREFDLAFTVKLQEKIDNSTRLRLSRIMGEVMDGSSFFASPEFSIIVIIFITTISALTAKTPRRKFLSLIIPLVFILLVASEIYGKSVVEHPAPPFFLLKNPTSIFPKYHVWEDYSYPSGHAARATYIAIIFYLTIQQFNNVTMKKKLWLIAGLGVYVLLVSISKVYLGHHWLTDVMGGWLLGAGWALLSLAAIH